MREHENDPDLQLLLENSRKRAEQRVKDTNLDTYDYVALADTIEPLSLWRIRMEYQGLVDPDTDIIVEAAICTSPKEELSELGNGLAQQRNFLQ